MIQLTLGRRGQGKTTLAYYVARQTPYRMIFDPRGLIRSRDSLVCGDSGAVQRAAGELLAGRTSEVVVTPESWTDECFYAFCRSAVRVLRSEPERPLSIVIDEVRFVDLTDEGLDWIMRTSDMDRVRVIFTGHRPKDVPTDIRAIADTWALFQFTLPRDLAVIEEQCSSSVAMTAQRLKLRQFIEWDDRVGTSRMFSEPARWYVPLRENAPRPEPEPATPGAGSGGWKLWDD